MDWTRRQYLSTATTIASLSVAGCTGLLTNHSHAEDPWMSENRESGARAERVEVDTSLPEGTYGIRTFNMNRGVGIQYEFENQTSNPLEVMFFQRDQLEDFQNGSEVLHQDGLHDSGVNPAADGTISAGNWLMAVVNSDYGTVTPEGDVEGTLTFVVSV